MQFTYKAPYLVKRPILHPKVQPKDIETLSSPTLYKRPLRKSVLNRLHPEFISTKFKIPVSISCTSHVPLREVLTEMGRLNKLSLIVDPEVSSALEFSAIHMPFIEVIRQIAFLSGLRYTFQGDTLCLFVDRPYSKTYNLQFLNCSRTSNNSISMATDVFSNSQGARKNTDNGSNSSINVSTTTDFWTELEANLKVILASKDPATYAIHKQAGLISVCGKSEYHLRVEEYLNQLRQTISSQVLVEAKIIEVLLNDEFRSGINWQTLAARGAYIQAEFGGMPKRFLDPRAAGQSLISLGGRDGNFSGILQALQEFGSSRILSSPRITVLNNQTAIIKVAQNQVYFRLNYDKQFLANVQRDSISVSSDIQTIPIGLVMSVQPSIDSKTGKITLFLRPTISRLSESVRDPAVDIAYSSNRNPESVTPPVSNIPVVELREIDSVLSLDSGEVGIFGGLMEARSYQDTAKLPILGDIPVLGEAFQGNSEGNKITELVVLIKATILVKATILESPSPDEGDQRLQGYIADPRPY